jgi:hypothetical protein
MPEIPEGWARHYYEEWHSNMYFAHKYHYYFHGRSLCKRSIQRMPDQPHYKELPEDHKEHGVCGWCMVHLIQGYKLPEHLWEDQVYEKYKGRTYEVLDRSEQDKE